MAVSGKTARRLLKFLLTTDPPSIHEAAELLANQLDNDVEGGQGTLAARPASSLRGKIYVVQGDATEANNGIVWWDTGTVWIAVNPKPEVYGASQIIGTEEEIEASKGRPVHVQVVLTKSTSAGELAGSVSVGGKVLLPQKRKEAAVGDTLYWSFICPPGVKYKVSSTGGEAGATRQYETL